MFCVWRDKVDFTGHSLKFTAHEIETLPACSDGGKQTNCGPSSKHSAAGKPSPHMDFRPAPDICQGPPNHFSSATSHMSLKQTSGPNT